MHMVEDKKIYDVIIVGAAFGGLAVASTIKKGRVLVIDTKPMGAGVKSACGTVLDTVVELGLEDCILQRHNEMIFHIGSATHTFHLAKPFCVVDGERFCQRFFESARADFIQAAAVDIDDHLLRTTKGDFQGKILVDASGPRAVLTKSPSRYLSFGFETIVDYQEQGLHFWYEPKVLSKGVFWLFPQGKTSRIGIASYVGKTNLLPGLENFLKRFNLTLDKKSLHSGFFPHRLREPVWGDTFLVGDAAGQCQPITGEGIRPAIFFGRKLGEIITAIIAGEITLAQGKEQYRNFVYADRKFKYETLYWGQKLFTNIPQTFVSLLAGVLSKRSMSDRMLGKYLRIVE